MFCELRTVLFGVTHHTAQFIDPEMLSVPPYPHLGVEQRAPVCKYVSNKNDGKDHQPENKSDHREKKI